LTIAFVESFELEKDTLHRPSCSISTSFKHPFSANGKDKVILLHAMKVYVGSGGITLHILN
jgi:hypothetical protein